MINESRTRVSEILRDKPVGTEVTVWGWVRSVRGSRRVAFIDLNDGTSTTPLQLVLKKDPDDGDQVLPTTGACVRVVGNIVESHGKGQGVEMSVTSLEIVGPSDESFPIQKKKHTFEFLRTTPHLRPRTNTFLSVFRMRSELCFAIHDYFHSRGFAYVHPPILTRSDCEGAGEAFRVTTLDPADSGDDALSRDFFGQAVYLTVSAQLEAEPLALALGEVYTFSPTFRADPSETTRHAAEFWMIEPEMAFYDMDDLLVLVEDFVKSVARTTRERSGDALEFLSRLDEGVLEERFAALESHEFGRITYTDAVELLLKEASRFEITPAWGTDLATEHERYLAEEVFGKPVFVTDYPKVFKPFYMRLGDDGRTVRCVDLLVPGIGEILSGSQREERLDVLTERMTEMNVPPTDYEWFLETRRWGTAPHSGFGIGFERLLMFLSGMKNIRDVIPFPRTRGRI